ATRRRTVALPTSSRMPASTADPATIAGVVESEPVAASTAATWMSVDEATTTPATESRSGNVPKRCAEATVKLTAAVPLGSEVSDATVLPSQTTSNAREAGRPVTEAVTRSPWPTCVTVVVMAGEYDQVNRTYPLPVFVEAVPVRPEA